MKIPKEFKLFGQTITVEYDKELWCREGYVGNASYSHNKITIQPNTKGINRSQEQIDQTFLHELVHHILEAMGEDESRSNEKFVDVFASLLHQFEITKK